MEALKSTLAHVLELVVCLFAAYIVLTLFKVDSDTAKVLVGVVINALAKFARSSDSVPLKDYVNLQ